MNELERLRALVSGIAAAPDRETGLAYVAAAKSVGKRLADELRSTRLLLDAHEQRILGIKPSGQVPLSPEDA